MREPTYFVLASLLDGPLHGYAIIRRTEELSDSRVRLATGTLYTALDRLTAEGYVELVREEIVNGRARRSLRANILWRWCAAGRGDADGGGGPAGDGRGPPPEGGRQRPEGDRVTPLERHCRLLLRAYPAWYRRERAGEMLGTLLEASPPGRRWPSLRDARSLVIGGLRVRGALAWCVAALGAAGAGDDFILSMHVPEAAYVGLPSWVGEPGVIITAAYLGAIAWLVLTIPVLVAGLVRLWPS